MKFTKKDILLCFLGQVHTFCVHPLAHYILHIGVAEMLFTKKYNILSAFVPRSVYFHMHILSILVLLLLPIRPQTHSVRRAQNQATLNSIKSKDK